LSRLSFRIQRLYFKSFYSVYLPKSYVTNHSSRQRADDKILQHLESLVQRATSISTLAVLRILNLSHSLCSSLIDDLKVYDATLSSGEGSKGATAGPGPLGTMLDSAMEEMFVPWLEGSRYLESENKNLVELYAGLLSRFTRYHVSLRTFTCYHSAYIVGNGTQSQAEFTAKQGRSSTLYLFDYYRLNIHRSDCCSCNFEVRQPIHIRYWRIHERDLLTDGHFEA